MKLMNYFQMRSCSIVVVLLITVSGCIRKPETIFNIDERFEKTASIPLSEVSEVAMIMYTEFGFFALENGASRVSKYSNTGNYVKSFGQKGSGPGEFECGLLYSYDSDKSILGIRDTKYNKISYFNEEGNYIESLPEDAFEYIYKSYTTLGITAKSSLIITEKNGKRVFFTRITVNDRVVKERKVSTSNEGLINKFLYSIADGIVYILETSNHNLKTYSYIVEQEVLTEIMLIGNKLPYTTGSENFVYFDNKLIFVTNNDENSFQFFYDIIGDYLGKIEPLIENRYVHGSMGEYLYIYRFDEEDNQFIDVYKAK